MNKVFKVIWNHATQTWTAVSELGHAKGKTKSKKIVKLTALAGAVIGSLAVSQTATAGSDLNNTNESIQLWPKDLAHPTAGRHAIAIGINANASHQDSIAIGQNSQSNWTNTIAIGRDTNATKDHAVAIGSNTTASGVQAVTVGSYSNATADSVVAIGQESNAGGKADPKTGKGAGTAAVAVGYKAEASAANTVAAGKSASASVDNAVALGVSSQASARNAAALGAYSNASGERAVAVGAASIATGEAAFAAGTEANASGKNAVAIGGAIEVEVDDEDNPGKKKKVKQSAQASGESAIAIGTNSTAAAAHSTSIGTASKASATQSIALGSVAKAEKDGAFAGGYNSTAAGKKSVALGFNAQANNENDVALGAGSITSGPNPFSSMYVGGEQYTFAGGAPKSVVSVGSKDNERQIQHVAAGRIESTSTDAVNGSQLYAVSDAISKHHWVLSGNASANLSHRETNVTNGGTVDFQNGDGTIATVTTERIDKSSPATRNVVKYHANIVNSTTTTVTKNADGSISINAKAGTDTTAAVTTNTTDALVVTNTTTGNVTTYNVDAKTGAISTTTAGSATYNKDGDKGGNYGARLTNVSTVTDIVNNVSWHLNSSKVTGTNGKITEGSDTEAADVKASNTVNINAGKNIEIKRNGTTIEISSTAGEKGEKGDTGATGAKGDTGATGAKGEKGDTGAAGAKGDKGDKGDTGAAGAKGDKGDKGDTGAAGAKGDTGAAGAKGDKGDKGDKGEDGVMTWDIKSTGNKAEGSEEAAKTIKHKNTVDMAAGKNLTVKQTSDENGAKVEFALNSTVTNLDKVVVNGPKGPKGPNGEDGEDGKDGVTITAPVKGKDGLDGKVGISGKDGKDAVSISGKDGVGQIGLTGPKGKDGKDGASINITTDNGKQTLVNPDRGADGEPGETAQRITYVPVDQNGKPLKDENGKEIKREVATMDDGLIFGGNTGEAHKAALGTQVNVTGAKANDDWTKFDAGKNIMTKVEGDTITVGLAKDLDVNNVKVANNVTAGNVTAGNTTTTNFTVKPNGNVDMGGNQVHNVKAGTEDTDAVNLSQLKANTTKVISGHQSNVTLVSKPNDPNGKVYKVDVNTTALSNVTNTGKITVPDANIEGNKGLVTAIDVANAINAAYWKVGDNVGAVKHNVTAGSQVNFVNGNATSSNVTVDANGLTKVSYDVNAGNGLHIDDDNKLVANVTDIKQGDNVVVNKDDKGVYTISANNTQASVSTDPNKGITVTPTVNANGTTNYKVTVDVDNDTITVNNQGKLVATPNGSTNFNVSTSNAGNKVANKDSAPKTTHITGGKTINYAAGKNIAIEQDNGNILISTTDNVDHNSVTTNDLTVNKGGNIDMGGNQIHNVKAGTKDTDAVNVSQLKQSIGDVHKRINKVGKEARGGIAGANAAAGLPQVYIPGKSMVAASAGTFKGESAVAVGYSRSSDNGKVIFKLQGNANTQGDVGGSVGVGYQW